LSRYKAVLVLLILFFVLLSLPGSCALGREFDRQVRAITAPYQFSIFGWEVGTLFNEVGKLFNRQDVKDTDIEDIIAYFDSVVQINELEDEIAAVKSGAEPGDLLALEGELDNAQRENARLADRAERIIETQIRAVLTEEGIFNPADKYLRIRINFPPVNFYLGRPPHLLVISPRDRIESMREITLLPDMGVADMEKVESEIDALGVSSLVVGLGGLATYVTDEADLRFIIETAAHEWLHQYLAFTPLGFYYVLDLTGLRRDYDIATMNETIASIIGKEIGRLVYMKYYAPEGTEEPAGEVTQTGFDFNREMREIRQTVDELLANGEIEQAETYMHQKREYLLENGYYIRKLNQAYFAFHGAYADSPTSISPIGVELRELRGQSASLKEFLNAVAAMNSRQDLAESVR
jgi:hypothetical protein